MRPCNVGTTYPVAHPSAGTIQRGIASGRRARTVPQSVACPRQLPHRAMLSHLAARRKVLSLGNNALVVVNIVLPTVLSLVDVGEAGVSACEATR